MSELVERLRSYIPNGDGYNDQFAHDMEEAADRIAALEQEVSVTRGACRSPKDIKRIAELETWANNVMALNLSAVEPFQYTKHKGEGNE